MRPDRMHCTVKNILLRDMLCRSQGRHERRSWRVRGNLLASSLPSHLALAPLLEPFGEGTRMPHFELRLLPQHAHEQVPVAGRLEGQEEAVAPREEDLQAGILEQVGALADVQHLLVSSRFFWCASQCRDRSCAGPLQMRWSAIDQQGLGLMLLQHAAAEHARGCSACLQLE